MQVILERSSLLKSLAHVQRVVERRNTIPILANVLIKADASGLLIKATDLDLETTARIAVQVDQPGATTVPAHIFHDIIRKFSDGSEIMLTTDPTAGTMSISSGKSRFNLQILPDSDFPDIAAGTFDHNFSISCADLKNLIDHTQFAISTEETRYYLNGIYMHIAQEEDQSILRAVATDGHRLAKMEIAAPSDCQDMPGVIVPRKAVSEIHKLIEDPDEIASIELSETKIRVSIGSFILTSKLIDGTFPNYNEVIPQNNDRKLLMERTSFAAAVDRVSTISSEHGRAIKMSLNDNLLVLSVQNPDSGNATEELSVEYESEALEIGFNARYLLDITNQLDNTQIMFLLSDSGSPALIRNEDAKDALFVLMPMRV